MFEVPMKPSSANKDASFIRTSDILRLTVNAIANSYGFKYNLRSLKLSTNFLLSITTLPMAS